MLLKNGNEVVRERKLRLEISEHGGTAVVRCRGRICFQEEAVHFSRAVVELLLDGRNVVLDFSGVEIVDSAGIGELVLVHMQAQAAETPICLVAHHSACAETAGTDQRLVPVQNSPDRRGCVGVLGGPRRIKNCTTQVFFSVKM